MRQFKHFFCCWSESFLDPSPWNVHSRSQFHQSWFALQQNTINSREQFKWLQTHNLIKFFRCIVVVGRQAKPWKCHLTSQTSTFSHPNIKFATGEKTTFSAKDAKQYPSWEQSHVINDLIVKYTHMKHKKYLPFARAPFNKFTKSQLMKFIIWITIEKNSSLWMRRGFFFCWAEAKCKISKS